MAALKTRTASAGMWLTQATDDDHGRGFYKEVSGFGDLDALFTEWSDEQKEAFVPVEDDEISDTEALEIITGK